MQSSRGSVTFSHYATGQPYGLRTWISGEKSLKFILFKFLSEFETSLRGYLVCRHKATSRVGLGYQAVIARYSSIQRLSVRGGAIVLLLSLRYNSLRYMMRTVPLAWSSIGILHDSRSKVLKQTSTIHLISIWVAATTTVCLLKLCIVKADYLVSCVEHTEAVLVRYAAVRGIRHAVLLMNWLMMTLVPLRILCGALHKLVSVLVGISKLIIDVSFRVS